ncbi:aspartate aminotransferase family protein [Pelagibius sp. CAU 1746]|uniref:aspartate aminotransferase family protein n=1 Tax=Pelagibius sp. CAU 1746 TaxID=3140370 RepID=UPI00325A9248
MSAVFHRDLSADLPVIDRGDGVYLIDSTGKRYLDASGGAAVSCLGHNHSRVIDRLGEQLAKVSFAHTSFFTNAPAEELADDLVARAPKGFGSGRAMFLGSGSEAMEAALKLARQYFLERDEPRRNRFIARRMAYHGNTLGALSVGGHMQRREPYAPLLLDVGRVSPCFAYRFKQQAESDEDYAYRLVQELDTEIRRIGPEEVAAFVVEPISGASLGCVPPVPGYFQGVREVCDRYGILLIADEVMCGIGRTGSFYALEQEGVAPDIITVAKGLGAGYQPIAAVLASEGVVGAIQGGSGVLANGHTYMSHAVACAGALAVLNVIDEENLVERVGTQGRLLDAVLRSRFGQHPNVGDIRGRGLFVALELVQDRETKTPFPEALRLATTIKSIARDCGLICYPSSGCADGVSGDHVLLAPPYIVDDSQIEEIGEKLEVVLARALERWHKEG